MAQAKSVRAELLAQAKSELAIVRGALIAAKRDGAPDYERGQMRAAVRRCEDDVAALQPRRPRVRLPAATAPRNRRTRPQLSLTYGKLPDRKTFKTHFDRAVGAGAQYDMTLNARDYQAFWAARPADTRDFVSTHARNPHGYTVARVILPEASLYELLNNLVKGGSSEQLAFASSILQTLDIEWV